MKIFIGSDHAGFELKREIIRVLQERGFAVDDKGAFEKNDYDDFPDFIAPVAMAVSTDPDGTRGIVIGGSGQGEAMLANRFPGVRALVCYGSVASVVPLAREHNNANVLSLGARLLSRDEALQAVTLFLETPFSTDEKYERRNQKMDSIARGLTS